MSIALAGDIVREIGTKQIDRVEGTAQHQIIGPGPNDRSAGCLIRGKLSITVCQCNRYDLINARRTGDAYRHSVDHDRVNILQGHR